VLSEDGFAADNRLPLIVPRPKPLTVSVEGTDDTAEFFRKLAGAVEGVTLAGAGAPATLRVARLSATDITREPRGGIFWPPADRRAQAPLLTEAVTPERDPLVAGLNWQGWFGAGPYGFTVAPGDVTLLWHGRWPLMFVRSSAAGASVPNALPAITPPISAGQHTRKLMLAFDWATSNASRLPATVLLMRRFLEAERDAQRAPYSANFDCGALIPLPGVPLDGAFSMTFESAAGGVAPPETSPIPSAERTELRAPGRAGFFTVRRDAEILVQGATQFADSRQGDFRGAERFFNEVRSDREAALERNTTSDPFVVLWLTLLAAVVLWSWWTRGSTSSSPAFGKNPAATSALPG
jgi:hypothetical protein